MTKGKTAAAPVLSVQTVAIGKLFCSPSNPRRNDQAVEHVAASLRRFGWQQPVVAKPSGEVIAGNTQLKAAKSLGMDRVPVVWWDGSDLDAVAYSVADNRSHEFAEWDPVGLIELLMELEKEDALEGVGFGTEDIQAFIEELDRRNGDELEDPEPPPLPDEPASKPGQLWALGRHRVLCGDATSEADVARLLGTAEPFLMVTDPPYGVEYDPEWRNQGGLSRSKATGKVRNDDRVDWTIAYHLFPGSVAYVWHAGRHCGELALNLQATDFEVRAQIIWRKPAFAISRGHYHWQHEPCWYAVRKGRTAKWRGDRSQSTVWEISNRRIADDSTEHGTQKPVECMGRPIRNHGGKADDVYDPFLGSGTTLIAAEQLGRTCFGLEIDPRYVDVIIARWEKLTGEKANLVKG